VVRPARETEPQGVGCRRMKNELAAALLLGAVWAIAVAVYLVQVL